MSQHKFKLERDGKQISVLAGWDRPLQQVFLTVESELAVPADIQQRTQEEQDAFWEAYDEAHEFLFDNLLTPIPYVDEIGEVLRRLNIPVPDGMLREIEKDRLLNAGNRVEIYQLPQSA